MATGNIRRGIDAVTGSSKNNSRLKNSRLAQIEAANYAKKLGKEISQLTEKEWKQVIDRVQEYELKKSKETSKKRLELWKEEGKYQMQMADTIAQKTAGTLKTLGATLGQSVLNAVGTADKALDSGIKSYFGAFSKYMGGIEARLQGSGKSFTDITGTISSAIGSSQYIRQTQVLENLNKLVSAGIAYNVELRAFLETASDKIATTFDAANGTLLQLIRIQQADTTAARLGLEASLTQFFNTTFKDSSYLSNVFDTVSSAILEANSQLSKEQSVAFEYQVQKWLGSMSSVGVSSNTIQMLAQGINYLGTGNVSALSSNTQLQNLMIMAAQASGLDYASMLTGGITATDVNKLLQGVVEYGQQIASNTNQVVKSQYAQLFGLTISDMTSLLNLSSQDLVNISKNMLTYSGAVNETSRQLGLISSRTSVSERVSNVFDNIMASMGESIASNAGAYATYLLADLIEKSTGGTNISAFGFDLGTVEGAIKRGIVGVSAMGKVGSILAGLSGANNLSLYNWGASATTGRGGLYSSSLGTSNIGQTTSLSTYIGSTRSSDILNSSVAGASEESKTITSYTENEDDENSLTNIVKNRVAITLEAILDTLTTSGVVVKSLPFGAGFSLGA